MPDVRGAKRLQADILHHLKQPDQPARNATGRASISALTAETVSTVQFMAII